MIKPKLIPFTRNCKLKNYMALPRSLLDEEINETAKLMYVLLLDRAKLSAQNQAWIDSAGIPFVNYTIEQLAGDLHKGKSTIKQALKTLEEEGLIRRDHHKNTRANCIYINVPEDSILAGIQPEFRPIYGQNSDLHTAGKPTTNKIKNKMIDSNDLLNIIPEEDISL